MNRIMTLVYGIQWTKSYYIRLISNWIWIWIKEQCIRYVTRIQQVCQPVWEREREREGEGGSNWSSVKIDIPFLLLSGIVVVNQFSSRIVCGPWQTKMADIANWHVSGGNEQENSRYTKTSIWQVALAWFGQNPMNKLPSAAFSRGKIAS